MPAAVAFRYARALADLAGRDRIGNAGAELHAFSAALRDSADLRAAMQSPAVPPARKRAVITRLAAMLPLSDLIRRFLFVVVDHRRTALLPDIAEAYEQVIDERLGVVRADISSARLLSDEQRAELTSRLTALTGKQVRAQFQIDPRLIGGVLARVGSTVYDGSVRGQLRSMKARLAGAQE